MSNLCDSATCAVCRRQRQLVFTSGPLEGFCERCAWNFDTRRLEQEKQEEAEYARLREER